MKTRMILDSIWFLRCLVMKTGMVFKSGYFASYSSRVTSSWQQRKRKPPNLLVQNNGLSSTDHTIQGLEKTNDLTDDKGPHSCPLPGTDQGINSCSKLLDQISSFDKAVTYSLPRHDEGTIVPTQHVERSTVTGRQKETNNVASDQGFRMTNAKSQPTRLPPRLPQNTSIGPHKPKNGVIREKILDEPTGICIFDWHEHSTMLTSHGQQKVPPELEHDEQNTVPPLSGIQTDEISVNRHHHAWDLPSAYPLPSVEGENEDTGIRDRNALERCVLVDQDYAYDGDSPSGSDVEADPHYTTFLANTMPDGTSYVLKTSDQDGLLVFLKYEKEDGTDDEHQYDRELEIHGVEKDQDNVTEKYKLGKKL